MTDTTTIQETKVLWDKTADKLYVWDAASGAWELFFVAADLVTNDALTGDLALKVNVAGDTMTGQLQAPEIGVNTMSDLTNKFAVKSNAALLAALEAASGGTGDIRTVLSKETVSNTASLLFQNDFSGRAEVGLCGDDNFHFKVSPDGSTFYDGIVLDKASGRATFVTAPNITGMTAASIPFFGASGLLTQDNANLSWDETNKRLMAATIQAGVTAAQSSALVSARGGNEGSQVEFGHLNPAGYVSSLGANAGDGGPFVSFCAISGTTINTFKTLGFAGSVFSYDVNNASLAWSFLGAASADNQTPTVAMRLWPDGRLAHLGAQLDLSYSRQTPTTGFSITVPSFCGRLILHPAGSLASGTITMPASPKDGQVCTLASTQAIAALNVQANSGQTIFGGFSSAAFAANAFAAWTYVASDTAWYRTG